MNGLWQNFKEKRDFFSVLVYAIISTHKTDATRLGNSFVAPNEDK